jgi:hypothetical protein
MKAGDWVYSYRKGIFRIERVVTRYYQAAERGILPGRWKVGDEYPSPMVLSKKAFPPDFKPKIAWDSCDAFFIHTEIVDRIDRAECQAANANRHEAGSVS